MTPTQMVGELRLTAPPESLATAMFKSVAAHFVLTAALVIALVSLDLSNGIRAVLQSLLVAEIVAFVVYTELARYARRSLKNNRGSVTRIQF